MRRYYHNGKWGEMEITSDTTINLHMAAECLHYGQEAFEGLKAFRCPDGKVRVFRMDENAARLQFTCRGLVMPELPTELFCEMVEKVIKLNERFIPPYESGAALYIRPLFIGITPEVGVRPAKDFLCVMFVSPVGPFAHEAGFAGEFYLDAKEKKYIDECGAANFFGIKNNTYITPKSPSILPSITNKSLQQIAKDLGYNVEVRPVEETELSTFEEAGACGTAAVISPINRIVDIENNHEYKIAKDGKPGPISTRLYTTLRNIQYGIEEDKHGWTTIIE